MVRIKRVKEQKDKLLIMLCTLNKKQMHKQKTHYKGKVFDISFHNSLQAGFKSLVTWPCHLHHISLPIYFMYKFQVRKHYTA